MKGEVLEVRGRLDPAALIGPHVGKGDDRADVITWRRGYALVRDRLVLLGHEVELDALVVAASPHNAVDLDGFKKLDPDEASNTFAAPLIFEAAIASLE